MATPHRRHSVTVAGGGVSESERKILQLHRKISVGTKTGKTNGVKFHCGRQQEAGRVERHQEWYRVVHKGNLHQSENCIQEVVCQAHGVVRPNGPTLVKFFLPWGRRR